MNRRDFIKRLGILIPAAGTLPGMLISDIRKPIELVPTAQERIVREYSEVDSCGLFSRGKLVVLKPFESGPRCLMQDDEVQITWTETFTWGGNDSPALPLRDMKRLIYGGR